MGNTELALRHFREALKLDPEHEACKADYKQAKKLGKLLEKIEAVLGKEVEGQGRQKKLEQDEQYEEARVLLDESGSGTDPTEGSALGMAVLRTLASDAALTMSTAVSRTMRKELAAMRRTVRDQREQRHEGGGGALPEYTSREG